MPPLRMVDESPFGFQGQISCNLELQSSLAGCKYTLEKQAQHRKNIQIGLIYCFLTKYIRVSLTFLTFAIENYLKKTIRIWDQPGPNFWKSGILQKFLIPGECFFFLFPIPGGFLNLLKHLLLAVSSLKKQQSVRAVQWA